MKLAYKIAVILLVLGSIGVVVSVALFSSAPMVHFKETICEVTCATVVAARQDVGPVFYTTITAAAVAIIAGIVTAVVESLREV